MATTPTQLPVPSEKPQDLKFNAGKIDEFVTSLALEYIDRFGQGHYTIEGLRHIAQQAIAAFGWIPVGTFQSGALLTLPNQILKDEVSSEYYRWDGSFPKDVPEDSTPDTTGGVMVGAWIGVGDSALRSMLLSSDGATMIGFGPGHTVADINDWGEGDGDSLVAVMQPVDGAIGRSQHEKNAEFLTESDFGIVSDGASLSPTDNSAALQAAFDASYTLNKDLHLSGDIYFTGVIKCRRPFISNGRLRIYGGTVTSAVFTSELQMLRGGVLSNVGIFNVKVNFFPAVSDEDKVEDKNGIWFYGNYGYNVGLYIGNDSSTVRMIRVYNNKFYLTGERSYPFVSLTNCSNVHVDNNSLQDYQSFIYANPTRSLVNTNYQINGNNVTGAASVISMVGSAMNWFSNVNVKNNVFITQPRTLITPGNNAMYLDYLSGLRITGNTVTSSGGSYRIRYSRDVWLNKNSFSGNTSLSGLGVILKVDNLLINDDVYMSTGSTSLALNISSDESSGTQVGNAVTVKNCLFKVPERALVFSNYLKVVVEGNIFQRNSALLSSVVQINNTCTYARVTNNDYFVPSGVSPISNSAITASTSGGTINTSFPAASITVIANGVVDSELNNSKSYVFSFTLSDVNQLHGYVSDTRMTLSSFVTNRAPGARLAWNGGFYNSDDNYRTGDCIADGTVVDFPGRENYWIPSMFTINREGKLSSRDFMCMGDNTKGSASTVIASPVRDIAQTLIAEGIVNSQATRPPLVSSGIIYDTTITDLMGSLSLDTSIGARTAIGQKRDGTWILICVDGVSGVTGCTLLQLATKMISLGARHACNLDGGGSTTVWYNGSVINTPSDGVERQLGSFLWV